MLKPYKSLIKTFCSQPFTRIKITSEGFVTMCCFQTRNCLGNILEKGLEEIWFSPLAEEIRRSTLKGNLHSLCNVSFCPFYNLIEKNNINVSRKYYPTHLEIDLPMQHCNIGGENPNDKNQACIMCERNFPNAFKHQKDKTKEICLLLRPYVKYFKCVHIQGIAEPFWKDKIFKICDLLELNQYENITISTTTNGTILNENKIRRFLEFPRSSITFSIDAATPETYLKIRRVNMYDQVVNNIRNYSNQRKKGLQKLRIHNNINLLNIEEVVGMVEVASELQVDNLNFNPTYGQADIKVDKNNFKLFLEAQNKIKEASERLKINTTFLRDLYLNFNDS